jgi:signal transduction histidine kinase
VAVAAVLEEEVDRLQPAAKAKCLDLVLQIDARPSVLAQVGHLRSLWHHLIDNAIRYTPRGRVSITLSVKPDWLVSTVSDTGIGIAQDDLARIFQEFCRSDAAKAEVELGTGLGLPIVCQILRLYEGAIEVDSAPGRGTTFTVMLPLGQPAGDAQGGSPVPPGTGSH